MLEPSKTAIRRVCRKNTLQGEGAAVTQLDHINIFSPDVDADSLFYRKYLGFKLSEQAVTETRKQGNKQRIGYM
ncbi:VOC family protein [Robertmurraya beringensis]|uniref:VOC family protein n=1 Tax=Robertmurraya beringensis TaxID=641660 RepID=A0ABV6KMP3_9BACI